MAAPTNLAQTVQLAFYHPDHKDLLYSFDLPQEQMQFTGMPSDVLEPAIQDEHQYPIVILADSRPVGFFILHNSDTRIEYTDNETALLLRSFSVNNADQGKGYAKQALLQLKDFVQQSFPQVEEIVLAVNMRNLAARQVYLKTGFLDEGRTRMGAIGPQHVLVMPIF
ncbi:GNAT family N-acetyltransferase [Brevibacillus nitrificans]|uniref:GNAT family N-acetyltransferase n=1 Tax=Brevibacillus nitrificans TaxID=651560 RepID=UPI0026199328|nr:GNAT family N-acetyltransferase [Brevibacillus nitrificans]